MAAGNPRAQRQGRNACASQPARLAGIVSSDFQPCLRNWSVSAGEKSHSESQGFHVHARTCAHARVHTSMQLIKHAHEMKKKFKQNE